MGKIFKSLTDLVRSDLLARIRGAQDPVKMFELLLADAQEFADERAQQIGEVIRANEVLRSQLRESERLVAIWAGRVKARRDDKVWQRVAMGEQIVAEKHHDTLKVQVEAGDQSIEALKAEHAELQDKIADLEAKRAEITVKTEVAEAMEGLSQQNPLDDDRMGDVLTRLDAAGNDAAARTVAAQAVHDLHKKPKTASQRFADMEHEDEITRRLQQLDEPSAPANTK